MTHASMTNMSEKKDLLRSKLFTMINNKLFCGLPVLEKITLEEEKDDEKVVCKEMCIDHLKLAAEVFKNKNAVSFTKTEKDTCISSILNLQINDPRIHKSIAIWKQKYYPRWTHYFHKWQNEVLKVQLDNELIGCTALLCGPYRDWHPKKIRNILKCKTSEALREIWTSCFIKRVGKPHDMRHNSYKKDTKLRKIGRAHV